MGALHRARVDFSATVSMIIIISDQGHSFQSLNSSEEKVFWGAICVCMSEDGETATPWTPEVLQLEKLTLG